MVHGGVVQGRFESPYEVGALFGLRASARYAPLSAEDARLTLEVVVSTQLAYGTPAMGKNRAERFIRAFAEMSLLDDPDTRCFSNGTTPPWFVPSSWRTYDPATGATAEGGVLVIARDRGACLWVEDED